MQWGSRFILLIIGCLVGANSFSQPLFTGSIDVMGSPFMDTTHKQQVMAFSILEAGSNSLPSAFISRLLSSGQITNQLKDRGFDLLKADNHGGLLLRHGVTYQRQTPRSQWLDHWWLTLDRRTQAIASFSQDIYGLVLYGNARYEDQLINLSGQYHTLGSQALAIGGQSHWLLANGNLTIGYSARLVQGSQAQYGTIDGTLYTAPAGAYLEGNFQGQWLTTDTAAFSWWQNAATGWGGHLHMGYTKGPWYVQGQLVVWEIMDWPSSAFNYAFAVDEQYDGIAINDLLSGEAATLTDLDNYLDTIAATVPALQTSRVTIQAGMQLRKWTMGIAVSRFLSTGEVPDLWNNWGWQYTAHAQKMFPKDWLLLGQMQVGGWAPFSAGLSVQKAFPFGLQVRLGTNHLAALALPQRLPGTSYHALLSYAF